MSDRTNHTTGKVEYINPDNMLQSPAFTQVVVATGPSKTVYIGMQNSVNAKGEVVGKGDLAAQVTHILNNIDACLQAAGAAKSNLVLVTVYLVDGQDLNEGYAAFAAWADRTAPPAANTVIYVPRLHDPDLLVGVEAVAVVPE